MFEQINLLAVFICAVLHMALGFLWYGFLFTKPWMRLSGLQAKHMENPENQRRARIGYSISALCALIMAFTLAFVVNFTGLKSVGGGFIAGVVVWLGFCLTSMLPNHLFSNRPIGLAVIDITYPLVSLSLMGVVLGFLG